MSSKFATLLLVKSLKDWVMLSQTFISESSAGYYDHNSREVFSEKEKLSDLIRNDSPPIILSLFCVVWAGVLLSGSKSN